MNANNSTRISGRSIKNVLSQNATWVGLAIIVAIFGFLNSTLFSKYTIDSIIMQAAELGLIVFPMALLMIAGSIDISVGAVSVLSGILAAFVMQKIGIAAGLIAGICFGSIAGIINGIFYAYLRVNPVVLTLGSFTFWKGLALLITDGKGVRGIPEALSDYGIGLKKFLSFPIHFYVLIVTIVFFWWLLKRNKFGRYIYAVGDNDRAAYLVGIRVKYVRFMTHVIVGAATGASGFMTLAKRGSMHPMLGASTPIDVLIIVLLGGVSFGGGYGKIGNVAASLFLFIILRIGLIMAGTPDFIQQLLIGIILVVAVVFSTLFSRRNST